MVGPNSLLQGGERRLGQQGGELSPYLASNRRALVITFNYIYTTIFVDLVH